MFKVPQPISEKLRNRHHTFLREDCMTATDGKNKFDRVDLFVMLIGGAVFLIGFMVAAAHNRKFEATTCALAWLCSAELLILGAARHAWRIGELQFGRGTVIFFRIRRDTHPIAFVIALFGIGAVFLILLLEIGIVASELLSYGREAIQKNSNQADVIHFDHGMEAKRLGGKIVAESDGRDRISCLNVDRRSVKMLLGYQYFDLPL